MATTFALSIIRLIQRLSIILTLGCCVYVAYFLLSKNPDNSILENNAVLPKKGIGLITPAPVLDLKPFDASNNAQERDIFSLTTLTPAGSVENTPKGQLPDHLKVVGILISDPSQIIIEDTSSGITYFIDEGQTQDGIKIKRVGQDRMTINYQGQDIIIPVTKN